MQRSLLVFQNTLHSEVTITQYTWYLNKFIDFYKLKDFDSICKIEPRKLQEMIEDYIMDLKKRYSPNSIPMFFYPLQSFFEANEVDLRWKKIKKLFPQKVKLSGDEAYSDEDVKKMLGYAITTRNKALIHFLASSGVRIGAIPDLKLKHLVEMPFGCKSILVYEDEVDEYTTFLTPEASKVLDEYLQVRRDDGEYVSLESSVFRTKYRMGIEKPKPMSVKSIQGVIWRCVTQSHVERTRKGIRFSKQQDHAFRKRFNTTLKLNLDVNPNVIEKVMGHTKGLDGVYLRPTKEQLFNEFRKGIVDLTLDKTEKLELENKKKQKKIDELESSKERITQLEANFKHIQDLLEHKSSS